MRLVYERPVAHGRFLFTEISARISVFCPFRDKRVYPLTIGGTVITNAQRMMAPSLRASGMGYGTIARKVGVSANTVKSFCRRNAQQSETEQPFAIDTPEHNCLCCGVPVEQNVGRKERKFCSDKCRNKWWNAHLDLVDRRAIREIICANCGKTVDSVQ